MPTNLKTRLQSNVVCCLGTHCWEWQLATESDGYAVITVKEGPGNWRCRRANRISYMVFKGPIPPGLLVCHSCDNRLCINPEHLWVGTTQQNTADRQAKGRHKAVHGMDYSDAKLTDSDVLSIRHQYAQGDITQQELGDEFGVTAGLISRIVNRKLWTHI